MQWFEQQVKKRGKRLRKTILEACELGMVDKHGVAVPKQYCVYTTGEDFAKTQAVRCQGGQTIVSSRALTVCPAQPTTRKRCVDAWRGTLPRSSFLVVPGSFGLSF